VSGGFKTFFREPARGIVKSPVAFTKGVVKGTAGLVGGVAGGLIGSVTTVGSAVSKAGMLTVAYGFTGDQQYAQRRELAAQQKAHGVQEGLKMGAEALRDGFTSGIGGLIRQPVRGAIDGGAGGAIKGVGAGIVGVAFKPLSGVAGFLSKVTEGIGAEAKKLTPEAREAARAQRLVLLRVRQPRALLDGVLRPYRRLPPVLEGDPGTEHGTEQVE
jgi:vacuolar protein sorting-associated protein 13A/C